MKFNVKYLFPTSSSGAKFYICSCLNEGLGMRKIVYTCKRIHKPGRTFSGFSQIFMEFCRSNVQLAPPHENILNDITNPKIVYTFFWFVLWYVILLLYVFNFLWLRHAAVCTIYHCSWLCGYSMVCLKENHEKVN